MSSKVVKRNATKKKSTSKTASKVKLVKSSKSSFVTDLKQSKELVKVGRSSSTNAIRASKALGLSITYLKNGKIIKDEADGTANIIKEIPIKSRANRKQKVVLKKGMVLYAK